MLKYVSLYQLWIKEAGAKCIGASWNYIAWWKLMSPKSADVRFKSTNNKAFVQSTWRVFTLFSSWNLAMPLVCSIQLKVKVVGTVQVLQNWPNSTDKFDHLCAHCGVWEKFPKWECCCLVGLQSLRGSSLPVRESFSLVRKHTDHD